MKQYNSITTTNETTYKYHEVINSSQRMETQWALKNMNEKMLDLTPVMGKRTLKNAESNACKNGKIL